MTGVPGRLAAAAALAVLAGAVPASATNVTQQIVTEECATTLTNAPAGTAASCRTLGPPPLGNHNVGVFRTARIVVASGAVNASLTCDNQAPQTTVATPTTPGQIGRWGGYDCTLRLVAAGDGTTAVGTSTYSYVINLD